MTGPLATLGHDWDRFVEATTDFQVCLLRRMAAELDHDTHAMHAIEGAWDWRSCNTERSRQ